MNSVFIGLAEIQDARRPVPPTPNVKPKDFDPSAALHVVITREPYLEWFTIKLPNGYTEELDPDETRKWFKKRGANMEVLEKALDRCWNFYSAEVWIQNPQTPPVANPEVEPDI